jgi:glycosyltransferase involved in cell wall biosynthesis
MTQETLISVVIPTYKRAHIVKYAIDSARAQTHKNIEVLVVDDGSPDDTESVVRSIPDERIRYIRHEQNKGLPGARNTGIRVARGEYVAFLDDDDQWRRDKLEVQLKAVGDFDAVLSTAVVDGMPLRVHRRSSISLDDLRRGSFDPSSLLAKTQVLREVLFDESLRQGEDWDAFIRIAQRFSIGWVPQPLLLYNAGVHARMTSEAKYLPGPEIEKRATMLHKHREFFGERWFRYHLADSLLSYLGSRPDRWQIVSYAIGRCGVRAVVAVVRDRVCRFVARRMWQRALVRRIQA